MFVVGRFLNRKVLQATVVTGIEASRPSGHRKVRNGTVRYGTVQALNKSNQIENTSGGVNNATLRYETPSKQSRGTTMIPIPIDIFVAKGQGLAC